MPLTVFMQFQLHPSQKPPLPPPINQIQLCQHLFFLVLRLAFFDLVPFGFSCLVALRWGLRRIEGLDKIFASSLSIDFYHPRLPYGSFQAKFKSVRVAIGSSHFYFDSQ